MARNRKGVKNGVYAPRGIKRRRRTKEQIRTLDDQIYDALEGCHPQSVRHVFYLMTDPRLAEPVPKSEAGYDTIKNRLKALRRSGRVPYGWVEDMSRRGYHVATYEDAADYLRDVAGQYRADMWKFADVYVEVWCESRSIAGVILPICQGLGVSLYPSGGNSSISFAYQAACNINDLYGGRRVIVFYIGDYDPAGVIIDKNIEEELRRHLDPEVSLDFIRLAITEEQIRDCNLPTKPRKESDRRSLHIEETVEAEAMPPGELRGLLTVCIEARLPARALEVARVAEESERDILRALADQITVRRDDDYEDADEDE
jgi:hypothetical protein